MKVILYMAMTVNGYIAKSDDDTSWISKEEWDSYSQAVRTAKSLIVGRRTYDILTKQPEFSEFKDIRLVVVATEKVNLVDPAHEIAKTPQQALEFLKDFNTVIVAGGGILNSSFLTENLVDEIFLDIEPRTFSNGIPLLQHGQFDLKLKLLDTKKISEDEIQLHYQILR